VFKEYERELEVHMDKVRKKEGRYKHILVIAGGPHGQGEETIGKKRRRVWCCAVLCVCV
jgi:hypothetical protein